MKQSFCIYLFYVACTKSCARFLQGLFNI